MDVVLAPLLALALSTGQPLHAETTRVQVDTAGPVAWIEVDVIASNRSGVDGEGRVRFRLPAHMAIGRMALLVEGKWMESEPTPDVLTKLPPSWPIAPNNGCGSAPSR